MARRIRRRPGVVWLPLTTENRMLPGQNATTGDNTSFGQYALVTTNGATVGDSVTDIFAVVADQPANVASGTTSLSDVEGSAYRLRRIVGKIFVVLDERGFFAANDPNAATSFIVTVGFIIVEVEPTQNFLPKSASALDYSTARLDNIQDPWIWRRSWLLGVGDALAQAPRDVTNQLPQFANLPAHNLQMSSALDGPHIDAKTARVVRDEQRLAMVVTVTNLDGLPTGESMVVAVTTDLRVLASMRKQSGNRHNASR